VGCRLDDLVFHYSDRGKPELVQSTTTAIHFNVTHSEDLALVAIACWPDVGIDVEICKPMPFLSQLMQRYCSPQEQATIAAQPLDQQEACFFYHWTAKEALTKATGQGMTDLEKVQLQFTTQGVKGLYDQSPVAGTWQVHLIEPQEGYAGAIAYATSEPRSLQFLDWPGLM
jgi:4'-phosphopantetheinyl transferase